MIQKPFELVPLGSICDLNPRLSKESRPADTDLVSFVPMAAVDEESASINAGEIRTYSAVKKGFTPFRENDVLFAKITPCMENGKVALAKGLQGEIGFGSTEFHVLRASARVLPEWLRYYVLRPAFRSHAKCRMTGAVGQQRVPVEFLSESLIPLPPVAEQRRLIDFLSRAENIVRMRREAEQKAKEIIPALFLDMFGDPGTNPKALDKRPLKDLIKVKSGEFLPSEKMDAGGTIPVFGGNGINGYHSTAMFSAPMVVIGRVGAYCGNVHNTPPGVWVTDNALYVAERFAPLRTAYLVQALRHAKLNQVASQAGQPLISGSRIYPIEILVPPEDRQDLFATRATQAEELARHQVSATESASSVFQSLLAGVFQE